MIEYLNSTVNVLTKNIIMKDEAGNQKTADEKINILREIFSNNEAKKIDNFAINDEDEENFINNISDSWEDYYLFEYYDVKKIMAVQRNGIEAPSYITQRKYMVINMCKEENVDEVTMYFINASSRTYRIASNFIKSLVSEYDNTIKEIYFDIPEYYHKDNIVFSIFQNEIEKIVSINVEPSNNEYVKSISMRGEGNDITDFYSDVDTNIKSIKGKMKFFQGVFYTDVSVKKDYSFSFKIPKKIIDMISFSTIQEFIDDIRNKLYKTNI